MPQFLVVYNQTTGEVEVEEYADEDRKAALDRRFALEREHRLEPHVEVVLLGARSRDVLERTHARYFQDIGELIANG
jgi:hypothetical protein